MESLMCILLIFALTFGWYIFDVHAMTIVDDKDPSIKYANSGPAWIGGNLRSGGTPHNTNVNGPNENYVAYQVSWHEALGDGAAVQFAFTGTHIRVNATVAITGYPLRVQFYMDNNPLTTYTNEVPAPLPSSAYDWKVKTPILDQDELAPAQHTLRMVTVGNDSLFLLDAIEFEASEALVTLSTGSSTGYSSSSTSAVPPPASTTTSSIIQTATELNTTSTIPSSNTTDVGTATQEVITITSTSGATGTTVDNTSVISSPSGPSPGTIAGAIVGGLSGLLFLVLLGLFLLQRHREKKHTILRDSDDEIGVTEIPSDETADGMVAGSGMGETSWPHDYGTYTAHEPAASGDPFRGPTSGAMPVPLVRVNGTGEGDEASNPNNGGQDVDDAGSMTYQTLPSYRERILEAQSQIQASNAGDGARTLSQADINAISQRLTDMMRVYIQQSGGNPQALSSRVIIPPRELIDHLVEERLNPREEYS